ncbi:CoA pyrophosphatase [Frischella sp. Ac13]|uniref:CoA pyrophosphatase n=1 Tax=Frischella japonica TaxID=2741544 RepID=A0ABR7QYI8_9GAMM|nr:CoA pyrophosphatase [Frischella japonica]MBC9131260.1 CoA pyrophosphatase [Frischella japonica]
MISIDYIENKLLSQLKKRNIAEKAAVLIPIFQDETNQLHLLFQVRSPHLKWQPNDICFPGGHMEEIDSSPIQTALRETHEELGIEATSIKILGQLTPFLSKMGLKIYPIIGYLSNLNMKLNHAEVAEVFSVPIDWFIANPPTKSHMKIAFKPSDDFPFDLVPYRSKKWQQHSQHEVYFYHYQHYTIWGLTAQIVQSFINIVRQ